MKIIIIGAGLMGVTSSFYLSRLGYEVTLIDSESAVANSTSFANGGQLSYAYVDPLASRSILKNIPGILLGKEPAFKMGFNTKEFIPWIIKFLLSCNDKIEESIINDMTELSLLSWKLMQDLLEEFNIDFDYRQSGKLHIYNSSRDFVDAQYKSDLKRDMGVAQEVFSPTDCTNLEPALLNYSQNIVGGIYSPNDSVGDAQKFCVALTKIAQEKYGLKLQLNTKVKSLIKSNDKVVGVQTDKGEFHADKYVVTLGVYSDKLLGKIGSKISVYPMKGYSLTFKANNRTPNVSITDAKNKMVISRLGDNLRVAGYAHFVGFNKNISDKYVSQMQNKTRDLLPGCASYHKISHSWVGLRPMVPTSVPTIGRTKYNNVWVNSGHGMLGWTLSLGSSFSLSLLIADEDK